MRNSNKPWRPVPNYGPAYDLHNELRALLDNKKLDRAKAAVALAAWYRKAEQSKLRGFKSLVKSFRKWNEYILNYFAYTTRYTNAQVQGINTKCKKVQRQGYGVVKFEHYKYRCQRAVNGSLIGLGAAPETKLGNFLNSPPTAKASCAGVPSASN